MTEPATRPCGHTLHLEPGDLHGDVHCPGCGTTWTAQRLLLVALSDPRVTIWAYPADVCDALGIPARTLRWWGEQGHVRREGRRYDAGAAFRRHHAKGAGT